MKSLKSQEKHALGRIKLAKLLKKLPKSVEALACIVISSSINNSFVPVNWKKSQIKMIPRQGKDRSKAEN